MNAKTGHEKSMSLWLLSRAGDDEKAWVVQAMTGTATALTRSADPWQCPITANGLQRLANKWAQGGKPLLALKISSTDALDDNNIHIERWQVRGQQFITRQLLIRVDRRDQSDIAMLKKARLRPMPVIDLNSIQASPQAGSPQVAEQGQPTMQTPALAPLVLLPRGCKPLHGSGMGISHLLPAPSSFALALIVALACAACKHLPPLQAADAKNDAAGWKQQQQQLMEVCRPMEENPSNGPTMKSQAP